MKVPDSIMQNSIVQTIPDIVMARNLLANVSFKLIAKIFPGTTRGISSSATWTYALTRR